MLEAVAASEAVFQTVVSQSEQPLPLKESSNITVNGKATTESDFLPDTNFEKKWWAIMDTNLSLEDRLEIVSHLDSDIRRIHEPIESVLPLLKQLSIGPAIEGRTEISKDDTDSQQLTHFRGLARHLVLNAYAELARGNGHAGLAPLIDIVAVSNKIENRSFIGLLSCIGAEAIALHAIKDIVANHADLSEAALRELTQLSPSRNYQLEFDQVTLHEMAFLADSTRPVLRAPRNWGDGMILENATFNLIYKHYQSMIAHFARGDYESAHHEEKNYEQALSQFTLRNTGGRAFAESGTLQLAGIFDTIEKHNQRYADLKKLASARKRP